MEMFQVGGAVRDEILGVPSKDIDFTVVLPPVEGDPFRAMVNRLKLQGFEIFLESPEYFTVRARFPKGDVSALPAGLVRYSLVNLTADFVLARKEGDYSDGRRPDAVEPGTLMDDLRRRDFTMNAIAKDSDGNLIDPFGGQEDIANKMIRAVGDAHQRIVVEDALRGLRAIRFSVTKGFIISEEVGAVLGSQDFREALGSISTERIQGELDKAFKVNTPTTMRILVALGLLAAIFDRPNLHLVTSTKGK